MTRDFADLIRPFIERVLAFQDPGAAAGQVGRIELYKDLVGRLERAETEAADDRNSSENYAMAKRALIYWADDILIYTEWPHHKEWEDKNLEVEYLKQLPRRAAAAFFEEAEHAGRARRDDALETFLLCVALGFRGRYRQDDIVDEDGLREWVRETYLLVEDRWRSTAPPGPGDRLAGPPLPEPGPLLPLTGPSWVLTSGVLVAATTAITVAAMIAAAHWRV